MMSMTRLPLRTSFVATAALFAALSLPVGAQTPQTATPAVTQSTATSAPTAAATERMEQRKQKRSDKHEQRTAKFKAKLELSPEQEAAWNTYQEALKKAHPTPPAMQKLRDMSTPERIDHMRKQREQHHAEVERLEEATKAFYAQLTPAQQKTFDNHGMPSKKGPGHKHDKDHKHHKDHPGHCW